MTSRGSNVMTDYAEDVLSWMQGKELEHVSYNGNSPQLADRSELIDFLRIVCETMKQSVPTVHLSVYLLDRFMDAHYISHNQLKLTALTAILLAAKFEERDLNVPRIPELNHFVTTKYSITIFKAMEAFMLNFYNWNVGTVTAAHFAEFYLMRGVSTDDTINGVKVTNLSHARQALWKSTVHFLDLSLQDKEILQWKSSQVAAACVACGRYSSNLIPVWSESLETTTGYSIEAVAQIMRLLLSLHEKEEKEEFGTPDSAYNSNCSSLQNSPVTYDSTNE